MIPAAIRLLEARRAGDTDPEERVVVTITGNGLKTLDAVRGTFEARHIEPSVAAVESPAAEQAVGAL